MIYLHASSSNNFTFIPSGSYSDGSSFFVKFTDSFSLQDFIAQGTGSINGDWVEMQVEVTSSYSIDANKSKLPLIGGTYDVNIYPASAFGAQWEDEDVDWQVEALNWDSAFASVSVYASESRIWSLMGQVWSNVPAIPTTNGQSILTTRAWVSESYSRSEYSANGTAAYYVYNG